MNAISRPATGAGAAVLVTWAWNTWVKDPALTPEAAAVLAGFLAPLADVAVVVRDRLIRRLAGEE